MDWQLILCLITGAGISGFVNGFAGFGTALFATGIWFAVLPFEVVPPLVVISAVTGQITGLVLLKNHLSFDKALPLISGGVIGVPIGTMSLLVISPIAIELSIAILLIGYAIWQLRAPQDRMQIAPRGRFSERVVGFLGGILGGIAGLSGPLPIVWFQLQSMEAVAQRARYQPFNLVILFLTVISMSLLGIVTPQVLSFAAITVPTTILASLLGIWSFKRTTDADFQAWILRLLLMSGTVLLVQKLI